MKPFSRYTIRHSSAFTYLGEDYPEMWHVTLKDSLGNGWDGGEFLTRDEAVAAGERQAERKAE